MYGKVMMINTWFCGFDSRFMGEFFHIRAFLGVFFFHIFTRSMAHMERAMYIRIA
jgi:hypothetical protein